VKTYSQQLGWAILSQQSTGLGDLFGQTIFRKQTPGRPDFMCSMALGSTSFTSTSVFFDNTEGRYTGMGILSSETCSFGCDTPVQLKVTVKTLDGLIISTKIIDQKKGVLYWMNLAVDFPETVNRVGMFVVEPVTHFSTVLSAFSLQFAPNGAFTVVTPFEAL
jgi:hypothetical protein